VAFKRDINDYPIHPKPYQKLLYSERAAEGNDIFIRGAAFRGLLQGWRH
jgi:hypothetical protein